MPVRTRPPHRPATLALLALAAILAGRTAAVAEDGFHPLDSTLQFMGLKTEAGAMPDFVQKTHSESTAHSYIPVGVKPDDRALKPKTADEIKAATADLDAARAAQLGGKRPKPVGTRAAKKAGPSGTTASNQGPLDITARPPVTR